MKINEQEQYLLKNKIEINYDNYKKYVELSNIFFFYSIIHQRQKVKFNYSLISYNPINHLFDYRFLVPCDNLDLMNYEKIIYDVSNKDYDYLVSPEFMIILNKERCLRLEGPLKIKTIFTVQFINKFFDLPFNFGSYKLVYTIDMKFLFHIYNNHFCPILASIEMLEKKSFHVNNIDIEELPYSIIFQLDLILEKEKETNWKFFNRFSKNIVYNLMFQNLYYRLVIDPNSRKIITYFIIHRKGELYRLKKSPILPIFSSLYVVLPFYKKAI